MKVLKGSLALMFLAMGFVVQPAVAQQQGIVVTVENQSPSEGTFQTPIWLGFHDGSFDIYDRDAPADLLPIPGSVALERLAEDGNTAPITDDFSFLMPGGVQTTVISNTADRPPLGPGESASRLFRLDPSVHRFFSYASMVIPSNDAFIANGNPQAHELFNSRGRQVLRRFTVDGDEVLDAGTEINDEIPANTAFFGQAAPNTGVDEGGLIVEHPGFLPASEGGILADPMFANGNFLARGFQNLRFSFRRFNINRPNRFRGLLTVSQEIPAPDVGRPRPIGFTATSTNAANTKISYMITVRNLTGAPTVAHFHAAPRGQNGPVVANLLGDNGQFFTVGRTTFIVGEVDGADVVGPLASGEAPFDNLLGELVARGIYVNIHTEANPAGEVRAQLR